MSTLEAYFKGQKELFEGLAIEQLETEWKQHPVLHLSLNAEKYDSLERLEMMLDKQLTNWETLYNVDKGTMTHSGRFMTVIEKAKDARGRADMVVKTDRYIYVFEFKFNGTPEEALAQIDDRGYLIPYTADGRELIKVGANFSQETRNIDRWEVVSKSKSE